ncbi:hypothetical protein AKJ51_02280 [candidate division MSBL1 archaeon SCGC-AAA382A20]|uniref:Uncharacterized protein n=1 Tax=candidate division MSBL1 archaeon SCGC-AAA382A20 TaxID=1698280 RepID=A0A133VKT4_9EURY|nr:hypothetical protein AKJ51_02280 [candidate division MSBL1 archaeon SCGC-AAA382A20]
MNEEYDPFEEVTPIEVLEGVLYYSFRNLENREEENFKIRDLQRSVYKLTRKEERLSKVFPFHQGNKYSEKLDRALTGLTKSNRVWRDRNVISGGSLNVGDSKNFERIEKEVKEHLPSSVQDSIEEAVGECIESREYEILN